MKLAFTKMHGLGNDFVVFDAVNQRVELSAEQVRFIADRRFGIGCDQVLLVERAAAVAADFRFRIFNAAGGEVEQCGNGARCFMRFVEQHGLSDADQLRVDTAGGMIELYREADGQIRVNMGVPVFEPSRIPFTADEESLDYPLEVDGDTVTVSVLSLGNPHAVTLVDDVRAFDVARLGPKIESHARFPNHVNAGFMEVRSPDHIRVRVYERGTGETLACGSGACAAVVAGRLQELLAERVKVTLPGGDLEIAWSGAGEPVWMKGPATSVYEGTIEL